MSPIKSLFTAGACAALSLLIPAQAAQPGWELTPGVTFERFDHNRHLKDAWGPRLGFGYNFPSKQFGIEAAFRFLNPGGKGRFSGAHYYEGEVDGLYYLLPNSPVEPYGLLGISYDRFHPNRAPDSRRVGGVAGVGLLWQITPNWGIRGDVRAEHPLAGVDLWDGRAMVGLQYNFGVPGATVATTEAPPPAPVRHRPPPDGDGDGVPDNRDQCPSTPAGAKVDNTGCQVYLKKPVTHTLHVEFAFDSSKIKNKFDSDIANLAHFLRQYPSTNTTLKGYADSTGPADYNLKLSERRAAAIRNRLIKKYGVASNRLKSKGFGEQNPVASNSTKAGRAQNRRVVAVSKAIKKVPAKKK